jgi:uncharacterized protein YdiU (UPF0061 family)
VSAISTSAAEPVLRFDNRFTRELPGDPESGSARRQIHDALYSRVLPTPVKRPELIAVAKEVAELVGLTEEIVRSDEYVSVLTGNSVLPGMDPHATCYGGHQFGNWAGQLGDGRAINLGEVRNSSGEHWMLQLKGAGPTPYSRTADGLAVLRSSLREFLCSEAMHHLGVPTTRALSLTLTGDQVVRDMFYDGNAALEPGAVVCRMAPSFTRFGHFEMLAARGEIDLLRTFAGHTIRADFPDLAEPKDAADKTAYLDWFAEISRRTAAMIVEWMRVGFVHGVMNTDNMSILGLTIDYGPYGWLENYDLDWTPNTTDAAGKRYRFSHQPAIARWNLIRLANALYPLIEDAPRLEEIIGDFERIYLEGWQAMMAAKLGLKSFQAATDAALFDELNVVLQLAETDMTIFYRKLAQIEVGKSLSDIPEGLLDAYYLPDQLVPEVREQVTRWLNDYLNRLSIDAIDPQMRASRMNAVNPKYVLRNYMAQVAIDAAEKSDFGVVNDLLELLRHPYDEQPGQESWAGRRPDWARTRAGCSMLSCSS